MPSLADMPGLTDEEVGLAPMPGLTDEEVGLAPAYNFNPAPVVEPAKTPESDMGDFSRGMNVSLRQLKPLAMGTAGLFGATSEKLTGYGKGLKDWGLTGYQQGMEKIQPFEKENDDVSKAWSKAKNGDIGALVDWAQYGIGYTVGQAGETVAMSFLGGLIGGLAGTAAEPGGGTLVGAGVGGISGLVAKGALKTAAKSLIEKAITKEAMKIATRSVSATALRESGELGAELIAKKAAGAEVRKLAAKEIGKEIGTTATIVGNSMTMELGSIYPEAEKRATEQGRNLTGSDLARVWGAGLAAGGLDAFTDKLGIDLIKGKFAGKLGKNRITAALAAGGSGIALEGGTEFAQTGLERIGAGQPLTGEDARRDYLNSAALGALGGGAVGGAGGLLSSRRKSKRRLSLETDRSNVSLRGDGAQAVPGMPFPMENPSPVMEKPVRAVKLTPGERILKAWGADTDVASAIVESVGPKLKGETGEEYRARLLQAHDNAGFVVPEKATLPYMNLDVVREAAIREGGTPEEIIARVNLAREANAAAKNKVIENNNAILANRIVRKGTGEQNASIEPTAKEVGVRRKGGEVVPKAPLRQPRQAPEAPPQAEGGPPPEPAQPPKPEGPGPTPVPPAPPVQAPAEPVAPAVWKPSGSMEVALRSRGYRDLQIAKLTPEQAQEALSQPLTTQAEDAARFHEMQDAIKAETDPAKKMALYQQFGLESELIKNRNLASPGNPPERPKQEGGVPNEEKAPVEPVAPQSRWVAPIDLDATFKSIQLVYGNESIGGNAGPDRAVVNFYFNPQNDKIVHWGNPQDAPRPLRERLLNLDLGKDIESGALVISHTGKNKTEPFIESASKNSPVWVKNLEGRKLFNEGGVPNEEKVQGQEVKPAGPAETAASKLAAKIRAAKLKNERGETYMSIVPPPIWNGAMEALARVIETGGKVADAVAAALQHIRDNFKEAWDESAAKKALYELTGEKPPVEDVKPEGYVAPLITAKKADQKGLRPPKAVIDWNVEDQHAPGTMGEMFGKAIPSNVADNTTRASSPRNIRDLQTNYRDAARLLMRVWERAGLGDLRAASPADVTVDAVFAMQAEAKKSQSYEMWKKARSRLAATLNFAKGKGLVTYNAVREAEKESKEGGRKWDSKPSSYLQPKSRQAWWDFGGEPAKPGAIPPALLSKLEEWRNSGKSVSINGVPADYRKIADAIELLIHLGTRPSEGLALEWGDVDWTGDKINIPGKERGMQKSGEGFFRSIPMNEAILPGFRDFITRLFKERKTLVDSKASGYDKNWDPTNPSNKIMGPGWKGHEWLNPYFKALWHDLGMPKGYEVSANTVRAFRGDRWLESGYSAAQFVPWLGHDEKTFQKYYNKSHAAEQRRNKMLIEQRGGVVQRGAGPPLPASPHPFSPKPGVAPNPPPKAAEKKPVESGVAGDPNSVEKKDAKGRPFWRIKQPVKALKIFPNFKKYADPATGVVPGKELKGPFDEAGFPPVFVWERNDGSRWLITGRHRVDLARREGVESTTADVYREKDGFTEPMAAALDAEQNIRDQQGTIYDYGLYFKFAEISENEARSRGLFRNPLARDAFAIGKDASNETFDEWYGTDGQNINDKQAVAIVTAAPKNEAAQSKGRALARQGKSPTEIFNLVKRASDETPKLIEGDMFGATEFADMDKEESVAEKMRKELRQRITVLSSPNRSRLTAAEEGVDVKLSPEQAAGRLAVLRSELKKLEGEWWLNEPVAKKVRERAGTLKKKEVAPAEPPKLRPGEKAGEVFQGKDQPFNLAGEKGVDAERIAKEAADNEAKAKAAAEYEKKNQQDMFGKKPPESRAGFSGLPTKEEALPKSEVEAQVNERDSAGFPVEVISRAEAIKILGPEGEGSDGFFDPETRKIFVVHENMRRDAPGRVGEVVREEAGHGLLRTTDGSRMLRQLLSEGKLALTDAEKSKLLEQGYTENQLLDEFVAKSAAENLPWWKAAIEKLREWLSKAGLAKLSNAEVSRILVRELRSLNETGRSAGSDEIFTGTPQSRGQVFGEKEIGDEYESERVATVQAKLRASERWNATTDVTPENTARIFGLVSDLTSYPTAESRALELRSVAPEGMAGGLFLSDAFKYAVRMTRDGDASLLRMMVQRHADVALSTGPATSRTAARMLRGLREGADDPMWVNSREIYKEIERKAASRLFGSEKLGELEKIIRELSTATPDAAELERVVERRLSEGGLGSEQELGFAERILKKLEESQTEWVDLAKRPQSEIKAIIGEALRTSLSGRTVAEAVLSSEQLSEYLRLKGIEKPSTQESARISAMEQMMRESTDAPLAQEYRQKLRDDLIKAIEDAVERDNEKIRMENEGIDRENETIAERNDDGEEVALKERKELIEIDPEKLKAQMERLSFEIWKEKLRLEANKAERARAKEANFEENAVKSILDKLAREQVEYLDNTRRSKARDLIARFLKEGGDTKDFVKNLTDIGVSEKTAKEMKFQAIRKLRALTVSRRAKAMRDESKRAWSRVNGVIEAFLQRMSTLRIPEAEKNPVRDAIRAELRIKPTTEELDKLGAIEASKKVSPISQSPNPDFIRRLKEMGVEDGAARRIATEVAIQRNYMLADINTKAMDRAAKSNRLSGLIEEILLTPYLAQQSPKWRGEIAVRWFMDNGLSRPQAEDAAKIFQEEFAQKLADAGEKLARSLTNRIKPGAETVNDFVRAVRAGLTDPSKPWMEAYAEKAGWKAPTPEQLKQLAELDLKLDNEDLTTIERKEITERMMGIYLHMRMPTPLIKQIAANFVATNLTGLRTFTINMMGPSVWLAYDRALQTVAQPHRFFEIWKPVVEAFRGFIQEFKYSLTTDAYTFINNEFEPASNELRRVFESGRDDLKSGDPARRAKGVVKVLFGSQQFFMRMLNAFDQAGAVAIREAQLAMYGGVIFREAGLSTADVNRLIEAVHMNKKVAYLHAVGSKASGGLEYSPTRARVHADALTVDMMRAFISENTGNSIESARKAHEAVKTAEADAYAAIGRLAPGVRETEEGGLISRFLGVHSLLDISSKMRRGEATDRILAVSMLGYLNIPIRTARFYLWNSPYGLLRMGIHKYRQWSGRENWWKQTLATTHQEEYRLRQALAATAVQALMVAGGFALFGQSSSADDTSRKNGFFITGDGPKNPSVRDAWLKDGFRPNSAVAFVNGRAAAMPLSRLGEPVSQLFGILSARDDYNWRKKEKESTGREFKETWDETVGYGIGNYVSLMGQRGIVYNIGRWARAGGSESSAKAAIASVGGSTLASASMPFLGMQRSIRDMAMGRVDTSSIHAALMANFPILGAAQDRKINRFGDPIGNQTWYGKIADTGVPIAFQVADNSENRRLYQMLVSKGVAPPVMRRAIVEEKFGTLTDDQFAQYARQSGANLKRAVMSNFKEISDDTQENAKKTLSKLASGADKLAAQVIGLEPLKTPAPTGGGGMSLSGLSSAGTGLIGGGTRAISANRGLLLGGSAGGRSSRSFGLGGRRLSSRVRLRRLSLRKRGNLRLRSSRLSLRRRRPRLLTLT